MKKTENNAQNKASGLTQLLCCDFAKVDEYNYDLAKEVWEKLENMDFKTGKEYKETAYKICYENKLPFSDLILYEKHLHQY